MGWRLIWEDATGDRQRVEARVTLSLLIAGAMADLRGFEAIVKEILETP
jgi:hypothetical protein